ncbi:CocE/NonD family hydrolase C-terminal non-catalytic domain-containing protein [Streptomyces coeruleorubidus]|uniref:CocE/NonD family hydrolase C-terminal non-catalytic domain-containing protein n=1 Tax=Streptomyces coeruleorubidus TaxID=116188 RepID=UPI003674F69C
MGSVTAPDTANTFAAGHRIRLDVPSSNFPRFDVNTNTGEPEAAARRTRPQPRTPCTWTQGAPPTCECGWKEARPRSRSVAVSSSRRRAGSGRDQ